MEMDLLSFYTQQGPVTDPGEWAWVLADAPHDVAGLVHALQGSVLHIYWAGRYGVELSEERKAEVSLRTARAKLGRMQALEAGSLAHRREPGKRLVGNCRDITVLAVSALRARGIPARARCGFATYFIRNHFEDHWVAEVWQDGAWRMVDAQLDELILTVLKPEFDPLNLPAGQFITGGEAWRMARAGEANPDDFGIFEWKGMDFIKGNLLRDLLALNRFEVLPWDFWGILNRPFAELSTTELDLLDRTAEAALTADLAAVQALVAENPSFQAPVEWGEMTQAA